MRSQKSFIVTMFLNYLYQACIRSQAAFGAEVGKYMEIKATLPVIALVLWWMVIISSAVERLIGFNVLFDHPLVAFPIASLLSMWITRQCLSPHGQQDHYKEIFRSWSKRKRKTCDVAVALFMVESVLLMFYTLPVHRK